MALYADGAYNKQTHPFAWATVVNDEEEDMMPDFKEYKGFDVKEVDLFGKKKQQTRRVVFCKFDDVKTQQNNAAELISLIIALEIAIKNPIYKTVYSDSKLIVDYWSKTGPSKTAKLCDGKVQLIQYCMKLRKEYTGKVEWIKGDDNIADLGSHK